MVAVVFGIVKANLRGGLLSGNWKDWLDYRYGEADGLRAFGPSASCLFDEIHHDFNIQVPCTSGDVYRSQHQRFAKAQK